MPQNSHATPFVGFLNITSLRSYNRTSVIHEKGTSQWRTWTQAKTIGECPYPFWTIFHPYTHHFFSECLRIVLNAIINLFQYLTFLRYSIQCQSLNLNLYIEFLLFHFNQITLLSLEGNPHCIDISHHWPLLRYIEKFYHWGTYQPCQCLCLPKITNFERKWIRKLPKLNWKNPTVLPKWTNDRLKYCFNTKFLSLQQLFALIWRKPSTYTLYVCLELNS